MRLSLRILLCLSLIGACAIPPVAADMPKLPSWYGFDASLADIPRIGVPVDVLATVTSRLGVLEDIAVSLLLPQGWTCTPREEPKGRLGSGSSLLFRFTVTPAGPLPNGSIGCRLRVRAPKAELIREAGRRFPEEANKIAQTINTWPDMHEAFADMAFALYEEEGFYPLGPDMWITYDDRLRPEGAVRGPCLYRDVMITPFQAQTDVEMFDKLQALLKSDPKLGPSLAEKGIDLKKKRFDQLLGLYVLAVEAYLKSDFPAAEALLNRFVTESGEAPAVSVELAVAAENLRGLAAWASGDRRTAEQALQKAFYKNRKLPVQRYILRNIGLLMIAKGDRSSAREMFRLATEMKPAYILAGEEYARLKER
ncbi:hypothetical protein KBA41_00140 [Candidatus Ozemobacteraceae bacterium]|nr:hypothetical protein [Candidatus Ozemobacteraceae bacterium]